MHRSSCPMFKDERLQEKKMKKKIRVKLKMKSKKFYDYRRDGITQGLLVMWMECRQKAKLFLDGYSRKGTSLALTYGSIGHGVLEHAYENFRKGKNTGAPSKRQLKKYLELVEKQWKLENPRVNKYALEDLQTSLAFAEVILPVYFEYWKEDFKKKDWQKIEGKFKVPLVLPDGRETFMRGMMDGMYKKGGMWLFETKFKSQINEGDIVDCLPFDIQVLLYIWALWKTYGKVPKGVLYNVVRRFGLKRKKTESLQQFANRCAEDLKARPEWYFYRFEVAITAEDMKEFEIELQGMIKEFMDWFDGESWHYKNPHSCVGKYGRCWCLEACSSKNFHLLNKRKTVFRELEGVESVG